MLDGLLFAYSTLGKDCQADLEHCCVSLAEVVRELALVVYDEVHYLKDVERGVVWEESIVLMPKAARMVFLSATIPNAREFAGWIAATHGSPVHVVYTEYRPTPLQHYIFPAGKLVCVHSCEHILTVMSPMHTFILRMCMITPFSRQMFSCLQSNQVSTIGRWFMPNSWQ